MARRFLTIMLIPDRKTNVKRVILPYQTLQAAAVILGLGLLLVLTVTFSFFYFYRLHRLDENMRQQNQRYRAEIEKIRSKISSVETYLERVGRFDKKLRIITNLEDPERHIALGPLDPAKSEIAGKFGDSLAPETAENEVIFEGETPMSDSTAHPKSVVAAAPGVGAQEAPDLQQIHRSLDELEFDAAGRESSLQKLEDQLRDMGSILRATPAIWPSIGWVTSNFGYRVSPFSGDRRMHEGIDIAARPGTPVRAPAEGIVSFIGVWGNYGKTVVLNHGYNTLSRYGHLAEINVALGDNVKRGDLVGSVGNTGRSTGPHLHYEVIVNGIPRDPRKYILD